MLDALIVEDQPNELRGLAEVLEREGFAARGASSLAEARALLAVSTPSLLMVDLGLPDGSGLDLLEELGPRPRPETVLMTANASVDTAVHALRGGARDYLVKPIELPRLRRLLARIAEDLTGVTGDAGEHGHRTRFGRLVGSSHGMQELFTLLERVGPTDAPVLIHGESGTGKELVAQTLHELSARRDQPLVALNCGAVSPTLVESELFGHERGSFTGAAQRHEGHFERACGGTLFLDEITEMPTELQTKLLRVIESQTVLRLGGEQPIPVDVRVMAATNRSPADALRDGRLRGDLFYRLNVVPIVLTPLREREGDVRMLAQSFLHRLNEMGRDRKRFTDEALERLEAHAWPGNVRELRNVVERAFIMAPEDIDVAALPEELGGSSPPLESRPNLAVCASLGDMERRLILATLEHYAGDKRRAARVLGVSLKTLYNRLHAYNYGLRPCRRS